MTRPRRTFAFVILGLLAIAGVTLVCLKYTPLKKRVLALKASVELHTKIANVERASEPKETNSSHIQASVKQFQTASPETPDDTTPTLYPVHRQISTTLFWVGEAADDDNHHISNLPSAWDEEWLKHFGGVDDPEKRSGFFPTFLPKENPFYFALPYNDFDANGLRKSAALTLVPWAKTRAWPDNASLLKNQWVKLTHAGKSAYAQWEDVGPFGEDDSAYVFGTALPHSATNEHAGLDLSPAAHDYLGLGDIDRVDWQFVAPEDVPDGPWKKIVTTSQIDWK